MVSVQKNTSGQIYERTGCNIYIGFTEWWQWVNLQLSFYCIVKYVHALLKMCMTSIEVISQHKVALNLKNCNYCSANAFK